MKSKINITIDNNLLSTVDELKFSKNTSRSYIIEKAVRKALSIKRFREMV